MGRPEFTVAGPDARWGVSSDLQLDIIQLFNRLEPGLITRTYNGSYILTDGWKIHENDSRPSSNITFIDINKFTVGTVSLRQASEGNSLIVGPITPPEPDDRVTLVGALQKDKSPIFRQFKKTVLDTLGSGYSDAHADVLIATLKRERFTDLINQVTRIK